VSADNKQRPPSSVETATERAERRAALLEEIWLAQAAAVRAVLASENPTASALQAARAFLRDNDVSITTLPRLRNRVSPTGIDPRTLPTFDDQDEGSDLGDGLAPALRTVQPFAPALPLPRDTKPPNDDD
jgi:hypothetical protein